MRLATLIGFLLGLGALASAAFAPDPLWRYALFASCLIWSATAPLLAVAVVDTYREEGAGMTRALVALGSEVVAAALSRSRPLGSLPDLPLQHLDQAGVSVGGLGLAVVGAALALLALRSRLRPAQAVGAVALLTCLLSLSNWAARH